MSLPEDFDFALELPATLNLGGKYVKLIEARGATDNKQVVFIKIVTEEEYMEEMGIEEDE